MACRGKAARLSTGSRNDEGPAHPLRGRNCGSGGVLRFLARVRPGAFDGARRHEHSGMPRLSRAGRAGCEATCWFGQRRTTILSDIMTPLRGIASKKWQAMHRFQEVRILPDGPGSKSSRCKGVLLGLGKLVAHDHDGHIVLASGGEGLFDERIDHSACSLARLQGGLDVLVADHLCQTVGAQQDDVAVFELRQRFRELLRAYVADTVANPAEIDAEMNELLAASR